MRRPTTGERFWAKVDKTDGCWNWTGATGTDGYGRFRGAEGKTVLAHRFSYTLSRGALANDLQVDHMCHNRGCVKPAHLRPVTNKQNSEHLLGAYRNNRSSGVRNVYWHKVARKWYVGVGHEGRVVYGGLFVDREDAEAKARAMRLELFTHNDVDRGAA